MSPALLELKRSIYCVLKIFENSEFSKMVLNVYAFCLKIESLTNNGYSESKLFFPITSG